MSKSFPSLKTEGKFTDISETNAELKHEQKKESIPMADSILGAIGLSGTPRQWVEKFRASMQNDTSIKDKAQLIYASRGSLFKQYALLCQEIFKEEKAHLKELKEELSGGMYDEKYREMEWRASMRLQALDRIQRQVQIGTNTPQWELSLFEAYKILDSYCTDAAFPTELRGVVY